MVGRAAAALFVSVVIVFAVAVSQVGASSGGRFTLKGEVVQVVDGDTVDVRLLRSGKRERVRLIGIDTPERGACFSSQATAATRRFALGKRVTLKGDPSQDTRDRYGRLLAYVWLPGGRDLGYQLIAGGFAKVYIYETPFRRLNAYRAAESVGRKRARSVWTCGRTSGPAPRPTGNCDPSYPTVCIPPYEQVGDLDCDDVPYSNFAVRGADPHGFDGDGDGVGCEE